MDIGSLNEKLSDQRVYDTLKSLERQLAMLPPDGKTNHKRNGIRSGLMGILEGYRLVKSYRKSETFSRFYKRRPGLYKLMIDDIQEAIENFNVQI